METKRQNRISRLIQKDLGEIFQRQYRGHFDGAMITVTKVIITPDLSLAKVYISLFVTHDKEVLINNIRKKSKEIRHALAIKVKHQLRAVPTLQFFEDDSLDYIENIENLLNY